MDDVEKFLEGYENINTTDDELRLLRLCKKYLEALNWYGGIFGFNEDGVAVSTKAREALAYKGMEEK